MASRATRRFLSSSSRLAAPRARTQSLGVVRRHASSEAGGGSSHAKPDSDTPWIIGSAVVFGPAFLYACSLNFGDSKGHGHDAADHSHSAQKLAEKTKPMKDDEGTEVSGADLANSLGKAEKDDVPNSDNSQVPRGDAKPVADDEGTEASGEDIKKSNEQASKSDSPKADKEDPHADGHPAQTSESESDVEQKEKPGKDKKGTFQGEDDSGPTNMGKARKAAKGGTAPKEAADDDSNSDGEQKQK